MISQYKLSFLLLSIHFSSFLFSQECLGGELRTVDTFIYGRFEVNMKSAEGNGYVSSFFTYHDHWADSDPEDWDAFTNEIDIEFTGNLNNSVQFTTHHPYWSQTQIVPINFNPHSEFHNYAVEWTSNSIRWFVDDIEVYSQSQAVINDLIFPQKIMMNLWSAIWEDWVGLWNPDTMPVMAYYDFVKYYEYTPGDGSYGSNNDFTLSWVDEFDIFDDTRWEEANHGFNSNYCQFDPLNVLFHDGKMILIASDADYMLGDVNHDSIINVLDIIVIVDMLILNGEIINVADYNQDSEVNVLDIVQIVYVILND